jgi:RNA polymerase sigma-70 factor (ECF subfamily)
MGGMDHLTTLLLDAQRGDGDALERFVSATHADVLALCRYLGDADNYEDLAQQTYERAVASLHRFRATGPARHWLFTIARRTCADATRSRIRRRRLTERAAARAPVEGGDHQDAAPTHDLDALILGLHPDRRAAFVLTQISGLRYDEAADVLGVPVGTIRSRVARARADLIDAGELNQRLQRPTG